MGSLLLSSGSWCTRGFVCALHDWSLSFPQSCVSPVIKSCWSSRSGSWAFLVLCQIPRLGKPDVGSEPSQHQENFFGIFSSPICGSSTRGLWDLIYRDGVLLVSLASSLSLDLGYLFGGFHPPVDGCSATEWFVLVGGHKCTSLYSAVLNWKPLLIFVFIFLLQSADIWQGIERT